MKAGMKMHSYLTFTGASDILNGNSEQSVADYDRVHDHILGLADTLSNGIIGHFPRPVSARSTRSLVYSGMRKLWEDHVTWTRLYLISAAAGLPDDATSPLSGTRHRRCDQALLRGRSRGQARRTAQGSHPRGADLVAAAKAGARAGGLVDTERFVAGVMHGNRTPSLAKGGRTRVRVTGDLPSRAARKIEEALAWLGVAPGPARSASIWARRPAAGPTCWPSAARG